MYQEEDGFNVKALVLFVILAALFGVKTLCGKQKYQMLLGNKYITSVVKMTICNIKNIIFF